MSTPSVPPTGVAIHYSQQFRRCGKPDCASCTSGGAGHGPYWFATWREDGRKRSLYLGREAPAAVLDVQTTLPPETMTPPALRVPTLRVQTLGGFAVWRGDTRLPDEQWNRRKAAALFKLLLSAPAHRLPREQVQEHLWPDGDPDATAHSLRTAIYLLRGVLDDAESSSRYLRLSGGVIALAPNHDAAPDPGWLDADLFESLAATALARHEAAACRVALAQYTGTYLPDDSAEEWAVRRRDELQETYLAVLLHLAALCAAAGEHDEAISVLTTALRVDSCHEEAARALMQVFIARDQPGQALRTYRRLARSLREELDLHPETRTQALYTSLLKARRATPHTPPIRPDVPPSNLPAALSTFIGRQQELAALRDALHDDGPTRTRGHLGHRLVTLTGPGGCGKTRLAVHVADEVLEDYSDGVWLVELAQLRDPDLVPQTVATALGLRQQDGSAPDQTASALLCTALAHKTLLLVLDNCEHVIRACASLAVILLRACPNLRILATSRETLGVLGELPWPVPPLRFPDNPNPPAGTLLQFEAVRLFLERARDHRPNLVPSDDNAAALATICRRLDGLPLAIELAAARIATLPLQTIATRLNHSFRLLTTGNGAAVPRHATLRATLDWSYDLLTPDERLLLRRLAVFAGGWTLEAAEAICTLDPLDLDTGTARAADPTAAVGPSLNILDLLHSLVTKSLVQVDEWKQELRYRLLETVRQYAQEHLDSSGELPALHDSHLAWFLTLAEQAVPAFSGPHQEEWVERLQADHDNLRAALTWAIASSRHPSAHQQHADQATAYGTIALRLASALGRFWDVRCYWTEGRAWLTEVLALDTHIPPLQRANALNRAGNLALNQSDLLHAQRLHQQALELRRSAGDRAAIAASLNNLGIVARHRGDLQTALALHQESLLIKREIGDKTAIAYSVLNLGIIASALGNHAQAADLFQEAETIWREAEDRLNAAYARLNRAGELRSLGETHRADALNRENLAEFRTMGEHWGVAATLHNLGRTARTRGDLPTARELYRESLHLWHEMGDKAHVAESLEAHADLAFAHDWPGQAVRLYGAASALRSTADCPLSPLDMAEQGAILDAARCTLGDDAFDAAWRQGQGLTVQQAVDACALLPPPQSSTDQGLTIQQATDASLS